MSDYSTVILAGGKSRRMGTDKCRLRWQGGFLLAKIAAGFSECDDLFLSGGHTEDIVPQLRTVTDCYPDSGPLAGVHAALCEMKHDLLFVTTCDAPLVDQRTAQLLLSRLGEHDAVVPVSADGFQHPLAALYRRRTVETARNMLEQGELRMRTFAAKLDTVYVPCAELPYGDNTVRNLNTPEDLILFNGEG